MFSRAAKSIVKTISQRKYPVGDENIKLAMAGGAGEIGRSLSQMLKHSSKLDVLALYDVASLNRRFLSSSSRLQNSNVGELVNTQKSRLLPMLERPRSNKGEYRTEAVQDTRNISQKETQELIDSLRRLPIAEEAASDQMMKTDKVASQLQSIPGSANRNQLPAETIYERMSTVPLEIAGSIAVAKEQRNRGPLSMTSSSSGSTILSTIDRTGQQLFNIMTKDRMVMSNGDRTRNDDYFPQGDEFEDEINADIGLSDMPSGRPYREEDLD